MSIFQVRTTPEELNRRMIRNMLALLDIRIIEIGEDYLLAQMPVNTNTQQTFGILHGGASVVLAESVGSIAANLCVDPEKEYCLGLDINANHLRAVREGLVLAKAMPVHLGSSTQVWQIDLTDEQGRKVAASRLTMAVRQHAKKAMDY